MLIDPAPERHERLGDAGQVRTWVNARLGGKTDTGPVYERHRLDILGVEGKATRERGVLIQASRLLRRAVAVRRVQESVDPFETDVETVLTDELIDRGDGGAPG